MYILKWQKINADINDQKKQKSNKIICKQSLENVESERFESREESRRKKGPKIVSTKLMKKRMIMIYLSLYHLIFVCFFFKIGIHSMQG